MTFCLKNTNKNIIMTEEDEGVFDNINNRRFCGNKIIDNKVRDHCLLTGKYRGPAHITCNLNGKQKDSDFISFIFHNFSNYDCQMFFKKLVAKKMTK